MAVKVGADLEGFPHFERKPGVWDPLLGVAWRKTAGRRWMFEVSGQGGGFGVGTDVDLGVVAAGDWLLAPGASSHTFRPARTARVDPMVALRYE